MEANRGLPPGPAGPIRCPLPGILGPASRGRATGAHVPSGRAKQLQVWWSDHHLPACPSPWLQVNSLIPPSPAPLVTRGNTEARGDQHLAQEPTAQEAAARRPGWVGGVPQDQAREFAPWPFSEGCRGPPGGPRPRCSERQLEALGKVGHLVTGPEQHPALKGHQGRKRPSRTLNVSGR